MARGASDRRLAHSSTRCPTRARSPPSLDRAVRLSAQRSAEIPRRALVPYLATTATSSRTCCRRPRSAVRGGRVLIDPNTVDDDSVSSLAEQPSPDGELVAYSFQRRPAATGARGACATTRPARTRRRGALVEVHLAALAARRIGIRLRGASPADRRRTASRTQACDWRCIESGRRERTSSCSHCRTNPSQVLARGHARTAAGWSCSARAAPTRGDGSGSGDLTEADGGLRPLIADGRRCAGRSVRITRRRTGHAHRPRRAALSRLVALGCRRDGARARRRGRRPARGRRRLAGGRLVVQRLHDAATRITVHDLDGTQLATPNLPGPAASSNSRPTPDDTVVHLGWTTFTAPAVSAGISGRHRRTEHGLRDLAGHRPRHRAGLRHEQGRRAGAAVPRAPSGRHDRRTGRTRPGSTATAVSASR